MDETMYEHRGQAPWNRAAEPAESEPMSDAEIASRAEQEVSPDELDAMIERAKATGDHTELDAVIFRAEPSKENYDSAWRDLYHQLVEATRLREGSRGEIEAERDAAKRELAAAQRKARDLQHERAFICQALQIDESADVIKAVCDQGDNLSDCEARYERLVAELAAREAEQLT